MVNGVPWIEVIVFAVFVGLRLYTRHQIFNAVGIGNYLCLICQDEDADVPQALHILYTIFVTIASHYGLGRLAAEFAGIMVIGVGKLAVGMFLLRIILNKSTNRCSPVKKSWNPTVKGTCWLDFSNISYTVGAWFFAMDFAFAIYPWFVVWDLNMKHKEKITVACGLSLGIFAGNCSINPFRCATIMCSSIHVLRPHFTHLRYGKNGKGSSSGNSSYRLAMYGQPSKIGTTDTSYQKTVITHAINNASNEDILQGAVSIERPDEILVTYERSQGTCKIVLSIWPSCNNAFLLVQQAILSSSGWLAFLASLAL
ncbi:hypothetical protein BDV12DRAFT_181942 [Aspergillus spectabilis]